MKIDLKNIDYTEGLSTSAHCFKAEVYINDTYVGEVRNRGNDAVNSIEPRGTTEKELLQEAERYCGKLAGKTSGEIQEGLRFYFNLGFYLDDLMDNYLQQKADQENEKLIKERSEFGIVFGNMKKGIEVISFFIPLEVLLRQPKGAAILTKTISEDILPKLAEGDLVLNRNIPGQILKNAGLKEHQYLTTEDQTVKQQKIKKPGKRI